MEQINLATELSEKERQKIADLVYEEYDADEQSRSGWLEMHSLWKELFYQNHGVAGEEWQSQESIPVLTEACVQFQARAYKAFFPNRNFVQAVPAGARMSQATMTACERVGRHMSYQLSVLDRNYKPEKNAMFLAVALHGCDFSKSYRDPLRNMNVVERVPATDLVLPYAPGFTNISQLERKTHIIYKSVNDTAILAQSGYFLAPAVEMDSEVTTDNPLQEVEDQAQGVTAGINGVKGIACLLEQHRLLDLDNDGIAEPYIVTIDKIAKKLLRISIRYETDENGEASNYKKPIEYFTQFNFLTNPDGVYGLGYGHVLGQLNVAINKMLRQGIDAATLANIGNMSGFVSELMGMKGGDLEISLGKFNKIPKTVDDIRKSLYTFQFPGANPSLIQLMDRVTQTAQRVGNTTDAVTGDIQKVMQPLTIMTLLESSLQLPTSVMEQMALSFEDEFAKLYRLNRLHFDKEEYITNGNEIEVITPEDYSEELRIIPIIDPRMITQQQKMAKAQQLFQFAMSNPRLAQNERSLDEITRRVLVSMETEDIDAILPRPEEPKRIDNQDAENAIFLLPPNKRTPFDVFPDQDHAQHIERVDYLLSILSGAIDPTTNQANGIGDPITVQIIQGLSNQDKEQIIMDLMRHRREHVAYLYGEEFGGQGQSGGMVAPGANPMGIEAAMGAFSGGGNMDMLPGQGGAFTGQPGGLTGIEADIDPGLLGLASLEADPRK